MSRPWESLWTPARCHKLARAVHKLTEMDGTLPHVRCCPDPFGRPGVVLEYPPLFTRQVELYFAQTGHVTLIRRDGAADLRVIDDRTRWLDVLREALRWRDPHPEDDPKDGEVAW